MLPYYDTLYYPIKSDVYVHSILSKQSKIYKLYKFHLDKNQAEN